MSPWKCTPCLLLVPLVALAACSSDGSLEEATGATGGANDDGSATGGSDSATGGSTPGGSGGATTGGAPGNGEAGGASEGSGGSSNGSSGCGQASAPTGLQEDRQIEVRGQTRTFVLSVPTDYSATNTHPLIFAWHGLGGSGSGARGYFGLQNQAGGETIIVYPDGLPNQDGLAAWDLAPDGADVEFFDALLEELSAQYCVDTSRVFSTGHSYGGYFTNRLGCTRGDVLRAVAPIAGGPPFGGGSNAACEGSVAAWITHGTHDETVSINQGLAALDRYLSANGCLEETSPVAPEPCVAYSGCAEGRPVVWCEHDATGTAAHGWPGFVAGGVWNFFSSLD